MFEPNCGWFGARFLLPNQYGCRNPNCGLRDVFMLWMIIVLLVDTWPILKRFVVWIFLSPCKQVEDEENEQDENDESGGEENLRLWEELHFPFHVVFFFVFLNRKNRTGPFSWAQNKSANPWSGERPAWNYMGPAMSWPWKSRLDGPNRRFLKIIPHMLWRKPFSLKGFPDTVSIPQWNSEMWNLIREMFTGA